MGRVLRIDVVVPIDERLIFAGKLSPVGANFSTFAIRMKWVALFEKASSTSRGLHQEAMTKGIGGFISDAVLRNKDLKARSETLDEFFPGCLLDDLAPREVERLRVLAVQEGCGQPNRI